MNGTRKEGVNPLISSLDIQENGGALTETGPKEKPTPGRETATFRGTF